MKPVGESGPVAENLLNDPILRDLPVNSGWKVVGPVVLEKKLGQGGMGAVYKGRHLRLNCPVAVKLMSQHLSANATTFAERFRREAQVAVALNHPNLVRCFDVNTEYNVNYMILEFIQGEDAGRRVKRRGSPGLPEQEVCAIIAGAAAGLVEAHRRNIVHRDIKPENIMIDHTGRVVLMDLGLAKIVEDPGEAMTVTGQAMGTPNYMSPEQWDDAKTASLPSDIWALGVSLYTLATGNLPWSASGMGLLMKKVQNEAMDNPRGYVPGLSDKFIHLIELCLQKKPGERITAAALQRELSVLAGDNYTLTDPAVPTQADSGVLPSYPSPSALSQPTPSGDGSRRASQGIDGPTVQIQPGDGNTDPTLISNKGPARRGDSAAKPGSRSAGSADDWGRQDIGALIQDLVQERLKESVGALARDPEAFKLQIHARLRENLQQNLNPTEQALASTLIDRQVKEALTGATPAKAGCFLMAFHPLVHLPIVLFFGLIALAALLLTSKSDDPSALLFFIAFFASIPSLMGIIGGLIFRSKYGPSALRHWAMMALILLFWLCVAGGCLSSFLMVEELQ